MKWINPQLHPHESIAELMMKLPFPNQAETTEHIPHQTTLGLGLQIPSVIYHCSLPSINKCLYSSGPGGERRLLSTQKGHEPCLWSELRWGVARKALLRVPGIWLRNTQTIVFRGNKRGCWKNQALI